MRISSEPWGTADGQPVSLYTLSNGRIEVNISDYGGTVQSIWAPDRDGQIANIAVGFSSLGEYVAGTHAGAIVGRYANRIAGGRFTLNGETYELPQNDGANTLHGGPRAFNTRVWAATATATELHLTYADPDGYNGFPGELAVEVIYALSPESELRIQYAATTTKPTVVNFTNHTYFNLAGEGSGDVLAQLLQINADQYTPVGGDMIPTGELAPVAGTPFDFRAPKPIGRDAPEGGYDHNFVLRGSSMRLAALAEDLPSGRTLETYTDQPGIQLYSGKQGAFALETQHFPNSPNEPSFPSTVLNPGQTFRSTTIYKFGVR